MAVNVDSQYVKIFPQGGDVSAPSGEIKNQQLNDALNAGTVEGILMKSTYQPLLAYNVVVKQNIQDFIKIGDVEEQLQKSSLNFEAWQDYPNIYDKTLQIKHSNAYATLPQIPNSSQLTQIGEIAVDNFDASVYALSYYEKINGVWTLKANPTPVKIDAGTVNGYVIERDVLLGGDDGMMTKSEIIGLINSAFIYNATNGSLTIQTL